MSPTEIDRNAVQWNLLSQLEAGSKPPSPGPTLANSPGAGKAEAAIQQYEEALRLSREAIRLDPENGVGWATLGATYAQLGQFDEAIDAHKRLADDPVFAWFIGTTYAAAGLEDKAREVAEQYPGAEFPLVSIYTRMGDLESALHWIAEAEKARTPWYPALLGWIIGNELNWDYTNPKVYDAVNDVSRMIHELDPNHPTTTTVAGVGEDVVHDIQTRAPDLDFVSFQVYGEIFVLPELIGEMGFDAPFMVTEWAGHLKRTTTGFPSARAFSASAELGSGSGRG